MICFFLFIALFIIYIQVRNKYREQYRKDHPKPYVRPKEYDMLLDEYYEWKYFHPLDEP
jgi:hypothetical protein